jgi:catechol-2,3-dioxygenase
VKVPTDQVLPPDLRHISLTVENEQQLAAWRDRLAAHDVPHWEEDHGEQTSLYFTDPSNVILEVTTPASRTALPPDPHAADVVAAWLADKD